MPPPTNQQHGRATQSSCVSSRTEDRRAAPAATRRQCEAALPRCRAACTPVIIDVSRAWRREEAPTSGWRSKLRRVPKVNPTVLRSRRAFIMASHTSSSCGVHLLFVTTGLGDPRSGPPAIYIYIISPLLDRRYFMKISPRVKVHGPRRCPWVGFTVARVSQLWRGNERGHVDMASGTRSTKRQQLLAAVEPADPFSQLMLM